MQTTAAALLNPLDYAAPDPDRDGPYKWLVVGMLWFVCLFNYADRQAIFAVFPLLKGRFGLTDLQLGVVGSAFMWVYAAAGPLAGRIADRVSRRALILGGLAFWSAVTLATFCSKTYGQLVLFRALEGLGEAFYFPASMSLIADYHGPRTRSRAMSIHQTSVYAGSIGGGAVAGFLARDYGWGAGFLLFGGAGIVLAILLIGLLREPVRGRAEHAERSTDDDRGLLAGLLEFFGNPMAIVLTLVFIGANFVANIFLAWTPTFLFRKFNLSVAAAAFHATVWFQVGSVLGVLAGGAVADWAARRWPQGRARVQAFGLLLGFPLVALAGLTPLLSLALVALGVLGFFKGMYDANIWAALFDAVPLRRRAFSLGLMNALGWLGASTAPIAVALVSARVGMDRCITGASAIYLVGGAMLLVGARVFPVRQAGAQTARGFDVITGA